jgi:hypothetical protein
MQRPAPVVPDAKASSEDGATTSREAGGSSVKLDVTAEKGGFIQGARPETDRGKSRGTALTLMSVHVVSRFETVWIQG